MPAPPLDTSANSEGVTPTLHQTVFELIWLGPSPAAKKLKVLVQSADTNRPIEEVCRCAVIKEAAQMGEDVSDIGALTVSDVDGDIIMPRMPVSEAVTAKGNSLLVRLASANPASDKSSACSASVSPDKTLRVDTQDDTPAQLPEYLQLVAYFQRFSGVAVIAAVVLAVAAVLPTVAVVLHALWMQLSSQCSEATSWQHNIGPWKCGRLPADFTANGTISNVAQDMMTPVTNLAQ